MTVIMLMILLLQPLILIMIIHTIRKNSLRANKTVKEPSVSKDKQR